MTETICDWCAEYLDCELYEDEWLCSTCVGETSYDDMDEDVE